MPMYAPMVAVAAQVPLTLIRAAMRLRRRSFGQLSSVPSGRFAVAGWSAIAALAVGWQAVGLIGQWPDREPALHGLGGPAAHAATTADRTGATAIYVASVDGTPRRFGAGVLPGLRYPWFKWFDPARSLPLPAPGSTAVYMLSELAGQPGGGDLTTCLGTPDAHGEIVIGADTVRQQCANGIRVLAGQQLDQGATFLGLARIDAIDVPQTAAAGETLEARLL